MNQTRVTWAVACTLLLVSGCDNGEFREIVSEEGRFKVQMPGTPKETSQFVLGFTMKTWSLEKKEGGYAVAFADIPMASKESDIQIQKRLEGARDGMVSNTRSKLTSSSRTTLNGKYPGRDVEADLPDQKGILRARIYLVGQRLYQIMVVGTKPWANSADATKFLDSLIVTP